MSDINNEDLEEIQQETKYFVDEQGFYIGCHVGVNIEPPKNAIEIKEPPENIKQKYNFELKVFEPFIENYKVLREKSYDEEGATVQKLVVAMFKKMEGENVDAELSELRALRAKVQTKHPKPTK